MSEQIKYTEALEQLRAAYEHEKIVLTARISTLEVSIGQQDIAIKTLNDSLAKAQDIVSDNIQTILRLQDSINREWLENQECHA